MSKRRRKKKRPIKQKKGTKYLFSIAVVLILIGLWLRLAGTMRLPLFWIEGANVYRVHQALAGELFTGNVNVRKWLYPIVLMAFQPAGAESVWLLRSISALMGVLSLAITVRIGRDFGGDKVGFLAGLFYMIMPLAVFHERQVLSDPLLSLFTTLITLLTIRLTLKPRWLLAILLGLSLAGAFLTKVSALPYLFLPFLAVLLFRKRSAWKKGFLFSLLSLVICIIPIFFVYQQAVDERFIEDNAQGVILASITDLLPGSENDSDKDDSKKLSARLGKDIIAYFDLLWRYAGIVVVLLLIAGFHQIGIRRRWRTYSFLILLGFIFGFAPVIAQRPDSYLAPRYLTTIAAPLVVVAALSLYALSRQVDKIQSGLGRWVMVIGIGAMILQSAWFDLTLISTPDRTPFTSADIHQYVKGAPSGYGYDEIAYFLLDQWESDPDRRLNVLMTQPWESVVGYLGPAIGDFQYVRVGDPFQRAALLRWLAEGEQVYFVESHPRNPLPDKLYDTQLELVAEFEGSLGLSKVYEVIGAEGQLAVELYGYKVSPPERFTEQIGAFGAAIPKGSPVFVHPATHAAGFEAVRGIPLWFLEYPLQPEHTDIPIEIPPPPNDKHEIQIVIIDEDHSDPQRTLSLMLSQSFYYLDDDWFGLIHHWRYVTGEKEPELTPLNAEFADTILLESGSTLDPQVAPGELIRFAFQWRSPVTIEDSFVVFVHIVDAEGNIIAQHDGIPGAGLLPMTAWQPGESIQDRFAVEIPFGTPPGEYTIRLGLYHPDSGLRLPVTQALEAGGDYVIVGRLLIVGQ